MKEYFKKYKLYIIIGVCTLILLVGGTLAYYTWKSTSNAVVNAEVCTPEIYFSGGATVNGTDMIPVLSKENGLTKQIELKVDKTCTKGTTMNLYLDLETFPTELADSSFVYELYKNGTKVTSGNFANKQEGSTITLVSNIAVTTTKDTYILYIWIDGNQDNPGTMAGKNFLFKLWASGAGAIYKENAMGNYGGSSRPSETSTFLGTTKARNTIQSIVSESSNVVPSNAIESVDISSLKDGSIMLWYTDTDSNGLYEAHIGSSNGIIELNTSVVYLFANLTKAESIDLSNFDTSKVTDMEIMFYYCSSLTNLDLSSFDTSSVTNMHSMFGDCSSLTNLDLSSFDTSNVTNMYGMFDDCSSLTNLDLSSFDTSNVTDMNYMFDDCKSLTNLDLSSFDTSKVTSMGHMFDGCRSLTNLDLSSFDSSNVTNMYSMFESCSSLTNLNLSNFNTSSVTNMDRMFCSCSSLTNLDLSSFNTSNVTNMSYMFCNCRSLINLNLSNFDTSKVTDMSYMFYNNTGSTLINLDLSNFDTSKVTDMSYMFYRCTHLKTIYASSLWNTSKVTQSDYMFDGCYSLKGAVPFDKTKTDITMANYTTGYLTYKANN